MSSILSVIVPCYNEEETVADFYTELMKNEEFFQKRQLEVELLYINDGSRDGTVREIKKLHEKDARVHLISFSRNFGKEAAMYAGLEKSKGDYVVFMDVDLQDPPALLPEMFSYIDQGYDSVATRRVSRKGEPPIRSLFQSLLPSDEKDLQDGDHGWCQRLQADDQTDGGCDSFHAGVQSLYKGNLWLGRL